MDAIFPIHLCLVVIRDSLSSSPKSSPNTRVQHCLMKLTLSPFLALLIQTTIPWKHHHRVVFEGKTRQKEKKNENCQA